MIFLLRHGEIETFDDAKRFIGQTDLPLSRSGREQILIWKRQFAEISFDRIICTPLKRTQESAAILAKGTARTPQVVPDLTEIHLGQWEGQKMETIRQQSPQAWQKRGEQMDTFRPPGGESFSDLLARCWPVFKDIAQPKESHTLIVGHAGVNRVLLCRLMGLTLKTLFSIEQNYACLNIIDTNQTPFKVVAHNMSPGCNLTYTY